MSAALTEPGGAHVTEARRLGRGGYAGIGLFAGGLALWTLTAALSGAVVAPASVVVENSVKKVQHAAGGVVSELLVKEGDEVAAGAVLLRLDDTLARTGLQIVSRQLDEARAAVARLQAERDGAPRPLFPAALTARAAEPELAALMAAELRLFEARARARDGMRRQLQERIAQLRSEIGGLAGQHAARVSELALNARELETVRSLHRRNLVPSNRLAQLERDAAALDGLRSQLEAQIAQAEGRIAEVGLQVIQIDADHRAEVLRELKDAQARLLELVERRAAAEDQHRRVEVRAPVAGFVHQLAVHHAGGVVQGGDPLMLIVPTQERLHLEARVAPADYDQVRLGQEVVIRLHAFNQRTTPELRGAVARMAADVSREPQGGPAYYTVRVALPPAELERLAPLELKAGMQAEAFLRTGDRSPLSFLVRPLADQFARAFRER